MSARRLRVLTMIDRLMTSGAEILATRVAMALDHERFESTICSTRRSRPEDVAMVEEAGVRVLSLNRRSRYDLWRRSALVRTLRNERIDVLHSHKFGSNVWASALGRMVGVPVVIAHEHTWSYQNQPLRRFLDRELIGRSVDAFLSVSEDDRRKMIEIEGVDPSKTRFIPNGIPRLREGDRAATRKAFGITPEAPVLGTVCVLRPQKALEVLIEAVAILAPAHPDMKALIVGDGPERARLEQLVDQRQLADQIIFLGQRPQSELPDLLAAFDVAVSSSDFEGTPLAIVECMAAGLPIVATRVGGLPGIIEHGVHGLLVPPRDSAALAEGIGSLLQDPERGAALGDAARERQRRELDFDGMVRSIEDLYESLYRSSRRHRATGVTP